MFEQERLRALSSSQRRLLGQARKGAEVSRQLVSESRNRVARSLELLMRTRPVANRNVAEDGVHFVPPIVIGGTEDQTELRSVGELIEFVRRSGKGTSVLRDEIFVAAALPSSERIRGIRALAIANFRSIGVPVR
jgi:hypothetical protein